jgi:ABC-type glycerol-3-phosphate transport system substrate-binding protein
MFKKTVILTVGLLLLAGISGWAEGSQEASEQDGPITVTVWNWSQENQEFFNEMAAQFNERHSGIQVQFETYVQDQYQQTLPLALKGGKGPDIFWLAPENNPRRFIQQDWIQPVGS